MTSTLKHHYLHVKSYLYIYIILIISIIYMHNLAYFITNICMRVFLIACVNVYVCFKGCYVIVGPIGN